LLTEIALLEYADKRQLVTAQVPKEGIAGYQLPESFTNAGDTKRNILVTASFGHIIPNSLLAQFDNDKRLNVHPSLLPRYRGAAPIQWTIANGDTETGVSVQRLVEKGKGIDGGDVVGSVGGIASLSFSTRQSADEVARDHRCDLPDSSEGSLERRS
jgi:methionyl-tRNA formyltransferase